MSQAYRIKPSYQLLLALVPAGLGALFSGYVIFKETYSDPNREVPGSIHLNELYAQAQYFTVKMSEELRGALLNPGEPEYLERKEVADESFSQRIEQIISESARYPEIQAIARSIQEYDEKALHHAEEKVQKLLHSNLREAQRLYVSEYLPARKVQDENYEKLKTEIHKTKEQEVSQFESRRKKTGGLALVFLGFSLMAVLGILVPLLLRLYRQLEGVGAKISMSGRELKLVSQDLTQQSRVLVSCTQEGASSIEEISSSMEEISGMLSASVKGSTDSVELSKQISTLVEECNQSMLDLDQAVKQIADSNARVENLRRLIEEIGEKTNLIDEIVFQTRLLSFNASVEAERAGEHGRGFAVVAQEVGNLAQMSGKSSAEITRIVRDSNKEAQEVATSNKAKVQQGVDLCKKTSEKLERILNVSREILSASERTLNSSQEQDAGVRQINNSVALISKTVQVIASNAQKVEDQSKVLLTQESRLNGAIESLSQLMGKAVSDGDEKKSLDLMASAADVRPPKTSQVSHRSESRVESIEAYRKQRHARETKTKNHADSASRVQEQNKAKNVPVESDQKGAVKLNLASAASEDPWSQL